ncbi:hypothetical protein [Ginsengibacter hankyongi]|nr:hypothetical protein [Ginsengibacter hankyongi]
MITDRAFDDSDQHMRTTAGAAWPGINYQVHIFYNIALLQIPA